MKRVTVFVYGREQGCASCVGFPSSKETASWLEAALQRKYGKQVDVCYVDIDQPVNQGETVLVNQMIEEERWFPVIVIDGEIVDEGNPRLKKVTQQLDRLGVVQEA